MGKLFLRLYLLIVTSVIVALLAGDALTLTLSRQELDNDYRRLAKGTFYLLVRDLQHVPPAAWPERLRDLSPQFGYPVSIAPLQAVELNERERARLMAGDIAVINDGDIFYQRIGATDFAVVMGPIGTPWVYHAMQLAIIAFLAGGIALAVWFWVRPLWRDVVQLEHNVKAFGEGTLSARAAISRTPALAPLIQGFNAMAERIERLIDSHKELTRAVAHELRTPIARLRFGVEMSQAAAPEERARYLRGMERDIAELDVLIAELLDYARFDRVAPMLDRRPHALATWLERVVSDARLPGSTVALHCDTPTDAQAFFDERLMTRALGNILRNAVRHARAEVHVTAEVVDEVCIIHVDDDGPGVPPAERERIFEPFVRLDDKREHCGSGSGLGLAIALRILHWHGGHVEARDAPSGGARVSLLWPSKIA